jgi:ribosome-binding protein aMBF1 (putative translation factor)
MASHRPFRDLTKKMSAARKARVAGKVAVLETAMALSEMRKTRALSQQELADKLEVGQPAVAKLEHRPDMYVSNLRRYVEALGGKLEITARFPDGAVAIDLDEDEIDKPVARAR